MRMYLTKCKQQNFKSDDLCTLFQAGPGAPAQCSFYHRLDQGCTTFSLLSAALRLFLWVTASSEFKIFSHCCCSASTHLFDRLSTKYPHTAVGKEFCVAAKACIWNCMWTAAYIFIEGRKVVHPWSRLYAKPLWHQPLQVAPQLRTDLRHSVRPVRLRRLDDIRATHCVFSDQARPVFQQSGDKSRIIMDDFSEYQANVQQVYPPSRRTWAEGVLSETLPNRRPGKWLIRCRLQGWETYLLSRTMNSGISQAGSKNPLMKNTTNLSFFTLMRKSAVFLF